MGIDSQVTLLPRLATEWQMSADGLSFDVTLREGVTFQDGTPFNAEAVKWNFDRLLDPEVNVPRRGTNSSIDSVEVTGDHSVTFHLNAPYPALAGALSMTTAAIISPASVDAAG